MNMSPKDFKFLYYLINRDRALLSCTRINDVDYHNLEQLPFDVAWAAKRELPDEKLLRESGACYVECAAFAAWALVNKVSLQSLIRSRHESTATVVPIPEPITASVRPAPGCVVHRLTHPLELQRVISVLEPSPPRKRENRTEDDLRLQSLQRLQAANDRQLPLVTADRLQALHAIGADFPNFQVVTEALHRELRLGQVTGQPMGFKPILLIGKPGIGKTEYINRLAEALSMQYVLSSIASMTGGLSLKGTSRQWGNCNIGTVAESMLLLPQKKTALMLLDEIDKIQDADKNMPIIPVLLELLEPSQLKRYRDEFLDISMDLSGCIHFIATANDLQTIPAPLLSRFRRIDVPEPTQAQMPSIIRSVDRSIRMQHAKFDEVFLPLSEEVMAAVSALPPRSLRRVLDDAYGHAVARGCDRDIEVLGTDIRRAVESQAPVKLGVQVADEESAGYLVMKLISKSSGGSTPPVTFH